MRDYKSLDFLFRTMRLLSLNNRIAEYVFLRDDVGCFLHFEKKKKKSVYNGQRISEEAQMTRLNRTNSTPSM